VVNAAPTLQAAGPGTSGAPAAVSLEPARAGFDARRLQLCLAVLWLLDGVLQLQPFMFTSAFASSVIAPGATGNPRPVASAITWSAHEIARHPVAANAAFAGVQIAIGLGIALRPTTRAALAASIGWALAVWWIGEGCGGILAGTANPLMGAPGAALLYALAAVICWPTPAEPGEQQFTAARVAGPHVARSAWVLLWGSLAWMALWPANRKPGGESHMISSMAAGQPPWVASMDHAVGRALAGNGLGVSVGLAVVLAIIALGALGPPAVLRAAVTGAIALSAVTWVLGENFGMLLSGQATDPSTGPLLALIALCYWPSRC
jgi:hypothetical protein